MKYRTMKLMKYFLLGLTISMSQANGQNASISMESLSHGIGELNRLQKSVYKQEVKPQGRTTMPRSKFIEDVLVNMPESAFRKAFVWDENDSVCRFKNGLKFLKEGTPDNQAMIDEHLRRAALFAGTYDFLTIKEIDQELQSRIHAGESLSLGTPSFRIVVHDPLDKKSTDVRALEADPKNKGAVFQVASTPFGVEAGMMHGTASLAGMLSSRAQGQMATIPVAGAAIFRKYIRPTFRPLGTPPYDYMWRDLAKEGVAILHGGSYSIDASSLEGYQYKERDVEKVAVGIHDDIFVTNGAVVDEKNGLVERIPLSENQKISQVVTSAYNVSGSADSAGVKNFARLALAGAYEATVKAARLKNRQRIFLTLMGGGVFANKIEWISAAIMRTEPLVRAFGLDVSLIFYPGRPPIRSAKDDARHLKALITKFADINGTGLTDTVSKQIDDYMDAAFKGDQHKMSQMAKQINSILG